MKNQKVEGWSPKEWVTERLQEHNFDYDYKTDALRKGDLIVEESLAISFLRLDALDMNVSELRSYIRDALNVVRHENSKLELKLLTNKLTYNPTPTDPVQAWVTAICGRPSTLDVVAMKHFIWQVKRKLRGLPVEYHTMPVLWGNSGIGKSVAVSRLIEPLKMVTLQMGMTIFSDQFSKRAFTRNFIIYFDELSGSESLDLSAMKQIITAPVVEWRTMRSERVMSAPQNSTFIGCSNNPVRDRIKDSTSSRRFWQINCADKIDWNAINSIDYIALWRSIDEKASSPLLSYINEIKKVQETEVRSKDIVEQWIEESCEVVSFNDSSLTTSQLYESFKDFCQWQNIKSYPEFQKFARDIKRIMDAREHRPTSKKTNRGTSWSIRIKSREAVSVDDFKAA